ncbi:hypothetical protein POV27_16790 [Aureisphaera galaxeae]|uniref:hypothetical protein n=1 Tax=Aureisphaera galaxeae TaxID=1538023 RepID=UPI00234FB90A|nr:hypothetical protein [Aureisphaera galaxeae]MDC8005718.1 hypothetical protein [Aureisphaera galaxeae]
MKKDYIFNAMLLGFLSVAITFSCYAQVGINTSNPADGAALDITSTDKGFLIPRVALTGTDDTTTITPSATTGLLVYNTVIAGALAVQVTPGFYYWSGVQWRRLYNQGYTLLYEQTAEVNASSSSSQYNDLTGMDTGDINIPFSGTYQIVVTGYYAAGNIQGGISGDGAAQASISLWMDTNASGTFTNIQEAYITSSSKDIAGGSNFYNLGQAATMIYTVDLDVVNTYRFKVAGRQWHREGVLNGAFGKDTNGYNGASGVNDGQRGFMTVCLIRQQ